MSISGFVQSPLTSQQTPSYFNNQVLGICHLGIKFQILEKLFELELVNADLHTRLASTVSISPHLNNEIMLDSSIP